MNARTICLVQSRFASTRLPGKALFDLHGRPLLWHVVTRCQQASTVNRVIVATGRDKSNDPIVDLCQREGWDVFRGPDDDVLARFAAAIRLYEPDVVVRVSGDSPLIDPDVIDRVVRARANRGYRYASNVHPPTWPDGLDVEAISALMLLHVDKVATRPSDREHVTPWLTRNLLPHQWINVAHAVDLSGYRLCIDTEADYHVIREVMRIAGALCTWDQAIRVLDAYPKIRALNAHIARNEGYAQSLAKEQNDDERLGKPSIHVQ